MGRSCYVLLRHCHDVLIKCRGDVPLRRRRWVFHLRRNCDVAGTYREMSLRRRYDVLFPGGLCTGHPTKEATDLFFRRALLT